MTGNCNIEENLKRELPELPILMKLVDAKGTKSYINGLEIGNGLREPRSKRIFLKKTGRAKRKRPVNHFSEGGS